MRLLADTIFALATGAGRSAIAILRLSGDGSGDILQRLCGHGLPAPRKAVLRVLRDGRERTLDQALVLWFPAPRSYTGEDCAELHLHGGLAVVQGVINAMLQLGARPAERGEFTRRAVAHGRMDLLAAEAVGDLIGAETELQRDQALRQMGGGLSAIYTDWSAKLLQLLAQQEALIDFPDEDLPEAVEVEMVEAIRTLHEELSAHLADGGRGERLRRGLVFAIAGPPNVGKSTLINALTGRDVAITSDRPGTTRDVLEARIEIAGVPVTLLDTAGLRETSDPIEAEGVRRANDRLSVADVVLALQDPHAPFVYAPATADQIVIRVMTKADLGHAGPDVQHAISAHTGVGMAAFRAALADQAVLLAGLSEAPAVTQIRHRSALGLAAGHLGASLSVQWAELRGEELRLALQDIGRVTGSVGTEDVLDSIFRQFCIGK